MKKIIVILCLIVVSNGLFAIQKVGNLAGRIIDKNTQKPVEKVNIYIDKEAKGISNEKGQYVLKNISIGSHKITFNRVGYEPRTKLGIVILADEYKIVNVELQVQAVAIAGISVVEEHYFTETEDAPVSSKTLDVEEIKSQPGGSYDIQRAIQAIPAVVAATDSENEIIVRGGNYGENLFVLDNMELENPNHFSDPTKGGGPVSMISPEFVEKVDFYAGAFPAKYGDKASSVLDVSLREGNDNKFASSFDIGMSGYGATIEGPMLKSKGNYLFSYHKSFLSLIKESIGITAVPEYQSVIGKQVINFSPFTKLSLVQFWGNDDIVFIYDEEEGNDGYTNGAGEQDIFSYSGRYAFSATLKKIHRNSYSILTAYINYNWWNQCGYDAGTKSDETKIFDMQANDNYNAIKFAHTVPNTFLGKFEFGGQFRYDDVDFDGFSRADTVFIYNLETGVIIDTVTAENENPLIYGYDTEKSIDTYRYYGYLQWDKTLKRIQMNAGVRYNYLDYTEKYSISPRFGIKYILSNNAKINFGLGRHFQNPDYFTLYRDEQNIELKPKYTDQIVLGFDKLLTEDIKFIAEIYYKKYYDVPIPYAWTTPDSLDWSLNLVNEGKGYAKGIELFLQKKGKDNFWGTISYSYSIANAFDPRSEDKEYSWDFDYRNVFTGILGYQIDFMEYDWFHKYRTLFSIFAFTNLTPADESQISIKYRYLGGKPYTEPTYLPELRRWAEVESQELNADRFPAYQRFDVHINHRWFYKKINIVSYLEVNNVFNTKNIWDYSYFDDGTKEPNYQYLRMIVGGVKVEF